MEQALDGASSCPTPMCGVRGDKTSTEIEQEEVDVPPRSTGPSHEPPGLVVLAELAAVYPVGPAS